ncbi:hypothetical protein ACFE04_012345 [Oxalis oulophora]
MDVSIFEERWVEGFLNGRVVCNPVVELIPEKVYKLIQRSEREWDENLLVSLFLKAQVDIMYLIGVEIIAISGYFKVLKSRKFQALLNAYINAKAPAYGFPENMKAASNTDIDSSRFHFLTLVTRPWMVDQMHQM